MRHSSKRSVMGMSNWVPQVMQMRRFSLPGILLVGCGAFDMRYRQVFQIEMIERYELYGAGLDGCVTKACSSFSSITEATTVIYNREYKKWTDSKHCLGTIALIDSFQGIDSGSPPLGRLRNPNH